MGWLQRRRLWAGILGSTVAIGLAYGQGGTDAPPGPPKVGDTISMTLKDGKEHQFKVMKVDKQEDGSYLSEVKDVKTGETITLYDKPLSPSTKADPPRTKDSSSKTMPKTTTKTDPLVPPTAQDKTSTSKSSSMNSSGKSNSSSASKDKEDPPRKPGLLARLFGKKPAEPSSTTPPTGANATAAPAMPPQVKPTPGLFPPQGGTSTEPPRVAPVQPVAPPIPLFPMSSIPMTPSVPAAPARTQPPAPMVPGLPSIPIPPGGTSSAASTVTQARYMSPATAAMVQEIQPYVVTVRTASAPSQRILAVQSLGGCRYASTDAVKAVLFAVCLKDPCPLVRACSIDELSRLGYFHPDFKNYLKEACDDPSEEVRTSAKMALGKMMPQH